VIGGEDADGQDVGILDLSGVRTNVIRTGAESGTVEFLDASGNVTNTMTYAEIEQAICFTPGTRIATSRGQVAVETLKPGDRVITRDNGIQPVRWADRRDLSASDISASPIFQPVLIRAGSIGSDLPAQDILVSPNHRMLLMHQSARLLFNESEVLVAAKHLVEMPGIDPVCATGISYIHVMFDSHEVILANGAWSDSFQPGDFSLGGIGQAQRDEILELFPELAEADGLKACRAARRSFRRYEARLLLA
jgi:hypothetical protein